MDKKIGIYVHVPYCGAKCAYCDFYSVCSLKTADDYTSAVIRELKKFSCLYHKTADTLYFGGGTPTLIGAECLAEITATVKKNFGLLQDCEVTCETNPEQGTFELFSALKQLAGINRLSIGMQSADETELKILGRRHCAPDVAKCVAQACRAGIDNISLDIMLGIPGQTPESLIRTVDFAASLEITHISAYILKIEPRTKFYKLQSEGKLMVPDDDRVSDMYLTAAEILEKYGYIQYEISNFAKEGFESRHNLKYWNAQEYLGVGAAAHSFMEGKRFYYENSISRFVSGCAPVSEGKGGDFTEYAMLRLRLNEGLLEEQVKSRFGFAIPDKLRNRARELEKYGLVEQNRDRVALTKTGFLVSNEILSQLLL